MSFLVIDTDKYSDEAIARIRAAMAAEDVVEEKEPHVFPEHHTLYKSISRALHPKSDVVDPNSDAQQTLDAMTPVGKEITIGIKITDSDRAQMLMGTMYKRYQDFFGVEVYSWGAFDIQKAQEQKLQAMRSLHDEFYQKLTDVYYQDLRLLIEPSNNPHQSD